MEQLLDLRTLKFQFELMSTIAPTEELKRDCKEVVNIVKNMISAIEEENQEKFSYYSDKLMIYGSKFREMSTPD